MTTSALAIKKARRRKRTAETTTQPKKLNTKTKKYKDELLTQTAWKLTMEEMKHLFKNPRITEKLITADLMPAMRETMTATDTRHFFLTHMGFQNRVISNFPNDCRRALRRAASLGGVEIQFYKDASKATSEAALILQQRHNHVDEIRMKLFRVTILAMKFQVPLVLDIMIPKIYIGDKLRSLACYVQEVFTSHIIIQYLDPAMRTWNYPTKLRVCLGSFEINYVTYRETFRCKNNAALNFKTSLGLLQFTQEATFFPENIICVILSFCWRMGLY